MRANQAITSQTAGNVEDKGNNRYRKAHENVVVLLTCTVRDEAFPAALIPSTAAETWPCPGGNFCPLCFPPKNVKYRFCPSPLHTWTKALLSLWQKWQQQCWFTFLNRCCHTGTLLSQGINCPSCCYVICLGQMSVSTVSGNLWKAGAGCPNILKTPVLWMPCSWQLFFLG